MVALAAALPWAPGLHPWSSGELLPSPPSYHVSLLWGTEHRAACRSWHCSALPATRASSASIRHSGWGQQEQGGRLETPCSQGAWHQGGGPVSSASGAQATASARWLRRWSKQVPRHTQGRGRLVGTAAATLCWTQPNSSRPCKYWIDGQIKPS